VLTGVELVEQLLRSLRGGDYSSSDRKDDR
jgi:hypothetical protein